MAEENKEEEKPSRIDQGLYTFEYAAEAEDARIEAERIKRLEKQLDYSKPALILAFYKKALEGRVFKTVEGYYYLVGMRRYLEERKEDLGAYIPCIPSDYMSERAHFRIITDELKDNLKNEKKRRKKYQHDLVNLRIVIVFLVVALIAMLVIALVSDNPNILNYERVLQDKYSAWELDLKEREDIIRQKELELKRENN